MAFVQLAFPIVCKIKGVIMNFKYTILRKFGIGGFLIIISLVILMSGFFPNMIKIIERNTSGEYYQTTANIVAISQARRGHEVTVSFNIPDSQKYTALLDTYVEGMEVWRLEIMLKYTINKAILPI